MLSWGALLIAAANRNVMVLSVTRRGLKAVGKEMVGRSGSSAAWSRGSRGQLSNTLPHRWAGGRADGKGAIGVSLFGGPSPRVPHVLASGNRCGECPQTQLSAAPWCRGSALNHGREETPPNPGLDGLFLS